MLTILYEDEDIIVPVKPAGLQSQSVHSFEPDMVSEIRNYLVRSQKKREREQRRELSTKPSTSLSTPAAAPYVGVIHRLDRPVSGIMVYARNQKAAASLSSLMQQGKMEKWYKAVVCGKPVDNHGVYVDYLRQNQGENRSEIVDKSAAGSKRAELSYTAEASTERCDAGESREYSLVRIRLLTGRHHQIRVQFSGHGTPLYGDDKYGEKTAPGQPDLLALCAFRLSFPHPVTGKRMEFEMEPSGGAFEWFKENPS
mgnify:CR=1 FL=1